MSNSKSTTRKYFNPPAPCGAGPQHWFYTEWIKHFNPPAPCGAGQGTAVFIKLSFPFQSTRPVRGGTSTRTWQSGRLQFQSTRPVRGGTMFAALLAAGKEYFNPPAPCGAGQDGADPRQQEQTFQSTRPVRGGTALYQRRRTSSAISIHPPRAGRDGMQLPLGVEREGISIHPPRAGRDVKEMREHDRANDFNPPAPCGAGLRQRRNWCRPLNFNPPAPCGAGQKRCLKIAMRRVFQSTRPVRGGTTKMNVKQSTINISIHPPRAGRDHFFHQPLTRQADFNPPAPCGAGPHTARNGRRVGYFNPPAPCGAGRAAKEVKSKWRIFQSTRPVRGGTPLLKGLTSPRIDFNPPAPCGAGQQASVFGVLFDEISIHPPRAGRDGVTTSADMIRGISIHPPRAGRDAQQRTPHRLCGISIHPPRAGRDNFRRRDYYPLLEFQSTRPVRGGTCADLYNKIIFRFQSTRPVRGGTLSASISSK